MLILTIYDLPVRKIITIHYFYNRYSWCFSASHPVNLLLIFSTSDLFSITIVQLRLQIWNFGYFLKKIILMQTWYLLPPLVIGILSFMTKMWFELLRYWKKSCLIHKKNASLNYWNYNPNTFHAIKKTLQ